MGEFDRPRKKKRRRRRMNLAPLCLLLALILAGLVFLAVQMKSGTMLDPWLPMGDVTIGGIAMKGMTKAEAKEALRPLAEASLEPLVIRVREDSHSFTAQDLGIHPDTDSAVEEAFRNRSVGKVDLLPYLGLKEETIRELVASLEARYNQDFSYTTCIITGTPPDLTAAPAENEPGQVLTVTIGRPEFGLDGAQLYDRILRSYQTGEKEITAQYRHLEPSLPDLKTLWQQSCVADRKSVV